MGYEAYIARDRLLVNKDNLERWCNTNGALLQPEKRPVGIVLEFPGLDGGSCLGGSMEMQAVYDSAFTRECAEKGVVVAYVFPGPWSWMNRGAVRMTDLVVDALKDRYGFAADEDCPLVVTGGSMGGSGALIYAMDSRHAVRACAAHCPCYNAVECFAAHPEFPRTFLAAVNGYDMPMEEALKRISPEHRIRDLPDIPYLVTADGLDECFPVEGVRRLADSMRAAGLDVTYMFLEGQPHGGISPDDRAALNAFLLSRAAVGT